MAFNRNLHNIESFLEFYEDGILEKAALIYNSGVLIEEFRSHPNLEVGGACLRIEYNYNGADLVGKNVDVVEWLQEYEDIANPDGPNFNKKSTGFDGIDEYVNFGDNHGFDLTDAFSFSCWVKSGDFSAIRSLFSKIEAAPSYTGYSLETNAVTGQLLGTLKGTNLGLVTFDKSMTLDTWHHVVLTYDGGQDVQGLHVYLDASVSTTQPSTPLAGSMITTENFHIASFNPGGTFPWQGNIDEFTVWNKELTQAEVDELYNSGAPSNPLIHSANANLVSYYKMGDGDTSPTISDSKGTIDGTMVNMDDTNFEDDTP